MLTGDKVETATCIAVSTGLKDRRQNFFFMKELQTAKECELKLREFETKTGQLLMIDGSTLDIVLSQ